MDQQGSNHGVLNINGGTLTNNGGGNNPFTMYGGNSDQTNTINQTAGLLTTDGLCMLAPQFSSGGTTTYNLSGGTLSIVGQNYFEPASCGTAS